MENDLNKQNVEEFLLVANEYCVLVENISDFSKKDFLEKIQKILGLLYLKTSVLTVNENGADDYVEKFVQKEDWQFIQNTLARKLASLESFFDLSTPESLETGNEENISLSEALADIYQDTKDIVSLFQIGNEDSLVAGLFDCKLNFERYWGPRLLAVLSLIHNILYGTANLDDEAQNLTGHPDNKTTNTDNWLINKKFDDYNK